MLMLLKGQKLQQRQLPKIYQLHEANLIHLDTLVPGCIRQNTNSMKAPGRLKVLKFKRYQQVSYMRCICGCVLAFSFSFSLFTLRNSKDSQFNYKFQEGRVSCQLVIQGVVQEDNLLAADIYGNLLNFKRMNFSDKKMPPNPFLSNPHLLLHVIGTFLINTRLGQLVRRAFV